MKRKPPLVSCPHCRSEIIGIGKGAVSLYLCECGRERPQKKDSTAEIKKAGLGVVFIHPLKKGGKE